MDFHALHRRDLQALCKRNGVRANMANAAMADALSALSKVDGIEEYVKQPAAAPEPEVKAAVAEEEARREKQGSPLPRGRRVTAKTSEPVKPDECKGKEVEKADVKWQSNKEEDAPVLGVGRRGTSRRARPAPVAAAPVAEPAAKAAEEKPRNLPPRTRRVPARLNDGVEKEDIKQDAKKEDAPVQTAVRRGPSRRTRPAPVSDESAAQPETKAALEAEEKHGSHLPCARGVTSKPPEPARPDDNVEEEEVKDQEEDIDDVPAQVVGRRGPSRRLRPAPVFSEPEDLWSPPPRGRRVTFNVKSSAPIGTEGSEANEKEDMQREANKGIMAALGVGRRGARGRARLEPAVPAPAGEVAAEEAAPIPRSRRGKGKASESIRVNGHEEENKQELKLDEKEEDVPAPGVARRGPSRRAQIEPAVPAPAGEVAAEEVALIPRSRRGKGKASESIRVNGHEEENKEENKEELKLDEKEEDVPAHGVARRGPSRRARPVVLEAPATRGKEPAISIEAPDVTVEAKLVRPTRARKPAMKAAAAEEEKVPRRTTKNAAATNSTLQNEKQQEEPQETGPALASNEECYVLENVEEAAGPHNIDQSKMIDEPNQEDKEVLMNEDDLQMEAILVRPTRVQKPTMKAAVLAEEKVPRKTTKKAAPRKPTLRKQKQQEEPLEAVPTPVSDEARYDLESVEQAADPQNVEQSVVTDEANQEDKEVEMNEDETLTVVTPAEEPPITEAVPAPVSDKARYGLESVEQAADPQNVEQSVVIDEPYQEDKEVDMNKDEMLMVETLSEEPPVTHQTLMEESLSQERPMTDPQNVEQSKVIDKPNQEVKEVEMNEDETPVIVKILMEESLTEEASMIDPQNVEQSEVIDEQNQQDKEVVMNKDEILMVDTLAEEPLMEESMSEEPPLTDPKNVEQSKVIDEQNQEVKEVEMNEDETLTVVTPAEEPPITEAVPAPVSDEARYDLESVEQAADPQNIELSVVTDEPNQEDKEVEMNEDETLTVVTPAEEPPVIVKILMEESLTEEASMIDPQNLEQREAIDKPSQDDKEVEMNEILMVKIPAEETPVIDGETKDKLSVEEQQVDVNPCASTLPVLEDSPVMGLVSKFAKQTFEKDEDDGAHAGEELEKDAGEEMENDTGKMMGTIQTSEGHADNGSEKNEAVVLDYSGKISLVVEEKAEETMVPELVQNEQVIGSEKDEAVVLDYSGKVSSVVEEKAEETMVPELVQNEQVIGSEKDEAVVLDYSGKVSSVVEEKAEETMVLELLQNEQVIDNNVTQATMIDSEGAGMEKAEPVTDELTQGTTELNEDVEEGDFQTYFVHVDELKEVVRMDKTETVVDQLLQSRATIYENVGEDSFQTDFTHVDEQKLVADGKKAELVTDKLPQSVATMDKDVDEDDGFQSVTMDEDVEKDFQTDLALGKEQKEITSANWVQEIIMNGDIVVEMQQSTSIMDQDDAADEQLETDFVLAEKQKDKATAVKPKLTWTDGEVDEEDKPIEETEETPQSIGTMDECIQEGYFQFGFVHADELKKVVTAENVLELSETEHEDVRDESAFTGDLPRDLDIARGYTDRITSGLLDDITESLSKITITEPTGSIDENVPICKNSSENSAKPVCKNSSEKNTVEPVFKNKSENKMAEPLKKARKALGRVDGNVCRPNITEQEQVRKLQQYQPGEEARSEL
ncbi:hypothetical protein PR202_gb14482 [Eleusine coracana subsp. coracana]|uniref:Titin-like n=1 Tax=Eleusine coracana subsp. coracana TaxID=191504 RepID=A0AAV5EWF5_ELECO|nr:hypothetical protein PR202_gb14482 [Eleusine coracana subsp. coracana]